MTHEGYIRARLQFCLSHWKCIFDQETGQMCVMGQECTVVEHEENPGKSVRLEGNMIREREPMGKEKALTRTGH